VVKLQGTWHPIDGRPTPVNLSEPTAKQKGVRRPASGVILWRRSFTQKRYPAPMNTNHNGGVNPTAEIAGGDI
jgi:hypothetical protein